MSDHVVRSVATAQEAVYAIDTQIPDLVVVELQLAGHSGIEFLYEIRSYPEWERIPIVVHTHVPPGVFTGSAHIMREQFGVKSYHYKPVTALRSLLHTCEAAFAPAS
jgi:CheY-like chemotaxis protein